MTLILSKGPILDSDNNGTVDHEDVTVSTTPESPRHIVEGGVDAKNGEVDVDVGDNGVIW